jgi:hypothetical protein
MTVLNPNLYDLLARRFSVVRASRPGEGMEFRYAQDLWTEKPRLDIQSWGESYHVNCPFCDDVKGRVSVNHRYATYDPVTGGDNWHLAKCFGRDCLKDADHRKQFREMVFGDMGANERRSLVRV